jgi:hypothetical protein
MFTPRYHGTVFNVFYSTDAAAKTAVKCHVITSFDQMELISADWKSSFQKWAPTDIDKVQANKTVVIVTLKSGEHPQIFLNTKPEPCDSLMAALATVTSAPKPDVRFFALSVVLPSFRFADKNQTMTLHKVIQDHSIQLVQAFQITKEIVNTVSPPFADIFSCLLRFRFRNEAAQQIDRSVREMSQDVKRHLLIAWCYSIVHCAESPNLATAKIYFSRLALHCSRTVQKAATSLGIDVTELMQLVENFSDQNGAPYDGLESAALQVAKKAQEQMDAEILKVPVCDLANLPLMHNLTVIALAACVVGMYQADLEQLAIKTVDDVKAVIARSQVDEARRNLHKYLASFLRDMLCFLDGLRYDEPFQFVFCVWPWGQEGMQQ